MGGKQFQTTRPIQGLIELEELKKAQEKLLQKARIQAHWVRSFHDKRQWGDLDIVVEFEALDAFAKSEGWDSEDVRTGLVQWLGREAPEVSALTWPVQVLKSKKSQVISVQHNGHQVDWIVVDAKNVASTVAYLNDHDKGNILGNAVKWMGLRLGMQGLFLEHRDSQGQQHQYGLTQDWDDIVAWLGLDREHHQKGFQNAQDLWAFFEKSPWFGSQWAQDPQQEALRARERQNRKSACPSFQAFCDWAQSKPVSHALEQSKNKHYEHVLRLRNGAAQWQAYEQWALEHEEKLQKSKELRSERLKERTVGPKPQRP